MGMPVVSIICAPQITFVPNSISSVPSIKARNHPSLTISSCGLLIECSSRPQKKATKHHMKTRPRKTQQWDVRRKPTVYAPLPPLPPDWTLVSSGVDNDNAQVAEAALAASALEAPASTG
ncbi:50S ribosomal protein 6 [Hibiscus syriacus]|uniref:50S ribosomal protein 6 n=1 Tax=Hibiscus syriacus TaxID=106335 RepID=A0A6A2WUQ7_HIBSY|nr:50S ribosomal protein 6, chloroplastic [Hibiscus syriacus]KAE8658800.1 50S ribosomal protein 6 [Hibiscus syriacus]